MRGQLRFLREAGFEVAVVSSPGPGLFETAIEDGVEPYPVPIVREISGLADLVSFCRLWALIGRIRPAIINVGTPKAGLLSGVAAYLRRVPCRVYTLRGLRCETSAGWKRWFLLQIERIACGCAHRVICVSESLRKKVVELGIADARKFVVLGSGSSNGVNVERFAATPERLDEAATLREKLGIPEDARVIGFVGRFTRDKGILELISAFAQLRILRPTLYLLLVGDFEEGDPVSSEVRDVIASDPHIVRTGMVQDPAPYYYVMDVVALPTHREGFPNVVLEAYAAGRAVVTTYATGARDSVHQGITGILVPVGDASSLGSALSQMIESPETAQEMGRAGRELVEREFRQEFVWGALEREFLLLLQKKGLPIPHI